MTRPFEAFLYCVEIIGGDVAKVGVSCRPKARISALAQTAPFRLAFRRVIGFPSRRVADAWERHIIANADRYRGRGEWVVCNDTLDQLLDAVTEGQDYTHKMGEIMSCGRVMPDNADISDVHRVMSRERLAGADLYGIEYSGEPDDYMPSIVRGRLRQGFGVEDIALMDDFPVNEVRACVSDIRKQGFMHFVLFGEHEASDAKGATS